MDIVKFTETIFTQEGKKGVLTPDDNGYYPMVIGALNTYNSAGEYYTAEQALQLFEGSSQLMRRIKNGSLYAEVGHPKRVPGMSLEQFYNRIIQVDETNVCGHISEVHLDFSYGKNNPKFNNSEMIGILGKVKPAGPKANALQLALENPKQNAAFSIRGLTENKFKNGRTERMLTNIITWDFVLEPGIQAACKAHTPGLEDISIESMSVSEVLDTIVDKSILRKVLKHNISHVALEDNKHMYLDILKQMEKSNNRDNKLSKW